MFTDRIEGKWVDAFRDVFELCKVCLLYTSDAADE